MKMVFMEFDLFCGGGRYDVLSGNYFIFFDKDIIEV